MPAKIITVCNQKGGAGKTTVSMQIAAAFSKRGWRTLVVDADPQATATRWAASAPDERPFPASVVGLSAAGAKVHREIAKFVEDYEAIIVDCPPAADNPVSQSALLVSDLALVPLLPSPLDLWASVGIRETITNLSTINEDLQARLLVNGLQPQTTLAREALEVLQTFGLPRCQTMLHLRTAYRQSAAYGGSVHDLENATGPAVREIEALTTELLGYLAAPPKEIVQVQSLQTT